MDGTRAARRERARSDRRRLLAGAGALIAAGALVAVGIGSAVGGRKTGGSAKAVQLAATIATGTTPATPVGAKTNDTPVEVPNVTHRPRNEAELVLTTAGFQVASQGETSGVDGRACVVVSQSPAPGTRLTAGDQVTLTLASGGSPQARPYTVVIDPGHQAKADLTPEPIGPGASEAKEKATVGAVGLVTKRHESRVALDVSLRLKARLEAAGVRVVMTRTSEDVDLSNIQRAQIANQVGANIFIRVHADAAASASVRGVSVLFPSGNAWAAPIGQPSRRAALAVETALAAATGAKALGTSGRGDLAGFNWSRVPAILVEAGSLANADEDRLLASPGYQDKVAAGIARGVLTFLGK